MLEVVVELGVAFAPEEDAEFEAPPLLPRFEPPPLPRPPRFPRVDRTAATSADSEGLGVAAATVAPLEGADDLFESKTWSELVRMSL